MAVTIWSRTASEYADSGPTASNGNRRILLPTANLTDGGITVARVRFELKAHSAQDTVVKSMTFGQEDPAEYCGFVGDQVQAATDFTVPAGTTAWTDWVNFSFDPAVDHLLHYYIESGHYSTSRSESLTRYKFSTSDESSTLLIPTYSTTNYVYSLITIEGEVAPLPDGMYANLPPLEALFSGEFRNEIIASMPALVTTFSARGANAALLIDLPELTFAGDLSHPSWMTVTLPDFRSEFSSGTSLELDLFAPEILLSAVSGATSALSLSLSDLSFSSQSGSFLSSVLPSFEPLFVGTSGTVAAVDSQFPALEVLFSGKTGQLGQLAVTLPLIRTLFTASQPTLGDLLVEFPPLQVLLSGSVGTVGSLVVTLPELEALLSGYPAMSAELLVSLPAIRALFEGDMTGRFDDYILQWVRPS